MVAFAFQSVFQSEMHQNDVFFIFLKIIFEKANQNDPKH
jgi:hypothetical protein